VPHPRHPGRHWRFPRSILRRVFADSLEGATQVDQLGAVQMERVNSRPTGRCTTSNGCELFAPCKVARPVLPAGMKEDHKAPSQGISGGGSVPFIAVTAAGEGEIVQSGETASAIRNDVVCLKRLGGEGGRTAAVFTSPVGALRHLEAQPAGRTSRSGAGKRHMSRRRRALE
jgi:hypothetical protein